MCFEDIKTAVELFVLAPNVIKTFGNGINIIRKILSKGNRTWQEESIVLTIEKYNLKYGAIEIADNVWLNQRILYEILQECSKQDDGYIQEMWAGLLASSVSIEGKDDSALIYVKLLENITSVECRICNYICMKYIENENYRLSDQEMFKICETENYDKISLMISHLRSLEILHSSIFGSFQEVMNSFIEKKEINLLPTNIGFELFARANGFKSIEEYKKVNCLGH